MELKLSQRIKVICKSRHIHVCLCKILIVGKIGICSNNISFGIFVATKKKREESTTYKSLAGFLCYFILLCLTYSFTQAVTNKHNLYNERNIIG